MLLKNVKKISLLVAISAVMTSVPAFAASLEEIVPTRTNKTTEITANGLIDTDTESVSIREAKPPIKYTDENGNYIEKWNQFKIIKKTCDKYSSVSFNEGLTSISSTFDPDIRIAFWDVVGDVIVPDTVTTISEGGLAHFGSNALNNKESEKYPCTLRLSNSLSEIPFDMCYCSNFTGTLRIPNSVKKIGLGPFTSCDFDTIIVPKTVEFIDMGGLEQGPRVDILNDKLGSAWSDVFFEGDFLEDYSPWTFDSAQVRIHYPKGATGFDRIQNALSSDKEKSFKLIPYEGTLEEALAQNEEQKRKDEEALKNGIYSDTISVKGYDISFSTHCIYTGKKIKLDAITVSDPNGKVFSDKQVKVRYKNNKNASRVNKDQASATFMITGIKGDKEANKAIKTALKNEWVSFTIHPKDLSNENLIISWKKNGDVRKVCYTIEGKKKTVPKKMWEDYEGLKFSKNFTGEYSLSGNNAE